MSVTTDHPPMALKAPRRSRLRGLVAWVLLLGAYATLGVAWGMPAGTGEDRWPLLSLGAFMVRTFTFHAGLASAGLLAYCLVFRLRWQSLTLLPIIGFALVPALASWLPRSSPAGGGAAFTLLNANVLLTNTDTAPLLSLIREVDPDIITIEEYTPSHHASLAVALRESHPHAFHSLRDDAFGMAIYSKFPFAEAPRPYPVRPPGARTRPPGVVGLSDPQVRAVVLVEGRHAHHHPPQRRQKILPQARHAPKHEVAASIGAGLAKAALAAKVDGGELATSPRDRPRRLRRDYHRPKPGQAASPDALALMRHSAAHVMAEAIQDVIGKDVQLAYGPPTDTGFFYDMFVPEGKKISSDHFDAINKRMAEIIKEDRAFCRYEVASAEGLTKLKATRGNKYKIDNAERALGMPSACLQSKKPAFAADSPRRAPSPAELRSPSTPPASPARTGKTSAAARTSPPPPASAPRASCPSPPPTGTAMKTPTASSASTAPPSPPRPNSTSSSSKKKKPPSATTASSARPSASSTSMRTVGQGLILWTPNGSIVRKELQAFIGAELKKQGYTEVFTPHIGSLDLYKTSGHFPYYKDSQFPPIIERDTLDALATCSCSEVMRRVEGVSQRLADGINERTKATTIAKDRILPDDQLVQGFMLKPMNCPHHAKIFASSAPLLPRHARPPRRVRHRLSLGTVGRAQRHDPRPRLHPGRRPPLLHRGPDPREIQGCLSLVKVIFNVLGMKDYRVRVGLRDKDSSKYTGSQGSPGTRPKPPASPPPNPSASPSHRSPARPPSTAPRSTSSSRTSSAASGSSAPSRSITRWPIRFDLSLHRPRQQAPPPRRHPPRPLRQHGTLLRRPHRALRRRLPHLAEPRAGARPPHQREDQRLRPAVVGTQGRGIRVSSDLSNDRVQAKVKVAADEKIPYMLIVGPRDAEANNVSVRARGIEKDLGADPCTGPPRTGAGSPPEPERCS
jgi:threonyl-tRNA synthetase